MKLSLIVAIDRNRGIGKNNDLLWHLPADMKFFKETTTGHIVVTGRKNYESIPERFRPLPNRENAVLTRNKAYRAEGALVFSSLENCLNFYAFEKERTVYIIGGGQIYKEAMQSGQVNEMYITHVDKDYDADTFFPEFDESQWTSEVVYAHEADEKNEAGFVIKRYSRN